MTPGPIPTTVAELEACIQASLTRANELEAKGLRVQAAPLYEEAKAFGALLCLKGIHTRGERCARCQKELPR
jgi:hypothetical protein